MGTTTVQTIVTRAATILNDVANETWTTSELIGWVSEAEQVIAANPGANTKNATITLVTGPRQTLPADCGVLIDIPYNLVGTGQNAIPGRTVRAVSREILDGTNLSWPGATRTTTVQNFVYDPREPQVFWVYPPNNGQGQVAATYAGAVTPLTTLNQTITLSDFYAPAILNYVLFRALSKDTEYVAQGKTSADFYAAFKDAVAGKQTLDMVASPAAALTPANPQASPGSTK